MGFSNIGCWIWPLLAGVICGIEGYLLDRLSGGESDTDDLKRVALRMPPYKQNSRLWIHGAILKDGKE